MTKAYEDMTMAEQIAYRKGGKSAAIRAKAAQVSTVGMTPKQAAKAIKKAETAAFWASLTPRQQFHAYAWPCGIMAFLALWFFIDYNSPASQHKRAMFDAMRTAHRAASDAQYDADLATAARAVAAEVYIGAVINGALK